MSKFIFIISTLLYFYTLVLLSFNKLEVLHVILYQRVTKSKNRKNCQTLQGSFIYPKDVFNNIINM